MAQGYLMTFEEEHEARLAAEGRADNEHEARIAAEGRADSEHEARIEEARARAAAEARVRQLEDQLRRQAP